MIKINFVPDFLLESLEQKEMELENIFKDLHTCIYSKDLDFNVEQFKENIKRFSDYDIRFTITLNKLCNEVLFKLHDEVAMSPLQSNEWFIDLFNFDINEADVLNTFQDSSLSEDITPYEIIINSSGVYIEVKTGFSNILTNEEKIERFIVDINSALFRYYNEEEVKDTIYFMSLIKCK